LRDLDKRLEGRKSLFRLLLVILIAFCAWKLNGIPKENWRPAAALVGFAYAAFLHTLFYLLVAPWIGRMKKPESARKTGFISSWVYLFFLIGPLFIGPRSDVGMWFQMGFIVGYALVFSTYGTYFEISRKTWMKP